MSTPKSSAVTLQRGPWLEYTLAAPVYVGLAVMLHLAQRPILFWLCVLFAIGSAAGSLYLLRSRAAL
jgi:hypothetical protein